MILEILNIGLLPLFGTRFTLKSPNDGVKPLTPVALREAALEGCISAPTELLVPSMLVYHIRETVSF